MNAKDTLSRISELLGMSPKEQIEMSETAKAQTPEEAQAELSQKQEFATAKLENGTVLEAEAFEAGNEIFIVSEEERVPVPVGEYEMEDGSTLVVSEEGIIAEVRAGESEESAEEVEAKEEEEVKMEYATKEEMSEVKSMIEDLAKKIEEMGKSEMSEEKEEEKTEMSSDVEVPSFKHSPEKTESKKENFRIAGNRPIGTLDRVLQNLNK